MDSVRWLQSDTMDMDRNVHGDEPAWRDNLDFVLKDGDTVVALVVSCASTLG